MVLYSFISSSNIEKVAGYPYLIKPIYFYIFIALATRLVHISTAYCNPTPILSTAFLKASVIEIAAPAKFPFESRKYPSIIFILQFYQEWLYFSLPRKAESVIKISLSFFNLYAILAAA